MTASLTVAARLTLDTADLKRAPAEVDAVQDQLATRDVQRKAQASARTSAALATDAAAADKAAATAEDKARAAAQRTVAREQATAEQAAARATAAARKAQEAAEQEQIRRDKASVQRAAQLQLQLNDIFTSLGSGQSPLTVAIQQGPQITQIYGGLGATLQAIPKAALAAGAALVFVATTLGAGIASATESAQRQRQYNIELQATGNIAGATAAKLDELVKTEARRAGAGRADTAAALGTFLANPNLDSQEALAQALAIARDLARVTGQDLPAASATLNAALDGTASGARRLDQVYNVLTASEHEQIRLLEEQGKRREAAQIVLTATTRAFQTLNEQALSPTAQSLNRLGNAWTDFADKVGKSATARATMFAATQVLNGAAMLVGGPPQIAQTQATPGAANGPNASDLQQQRDQLADAEQRLADLRERARQAIRPLTIESDIAAQEKRVAELRANVGYIAEQLKATETATTKARTDAEATSASNSAQRQTKELQELIASVSTVEAQRRQLAAKRDRLVEAIDFGGLSPEALKEARAGLRELDGQLSALSTTSEKLQRNLDLESRYAKMRPDQAERERAADQARKAALDAGDTRAEAERKADQARQSVQDRQATQTAQQISLLGAEARAALAVADAYGRSRAAGLAAAALGAAQSAEEQGSIAPGSAAAVARETLEKNAAATVAAAAEKNRAYREEIEGLDRLAAAEEVSSEAAREAERANRVAALAIELRAQAAASGSAAIAAAAEREIASYDRLSRQQQQLDRRRAAGQLNAQYDPEVNYRQRIATLEELQKTGVLTERTVAEATRQYEQERLDASRATTDGMRAGLMRYAEDATNAGRAASNGAQAVFQGLEDAGVQATTTLRFSFTNMANSIIADLARIAIRQSITGPLAQATGSALGSFGGWLGGMFGSNATNPAYNVGGNIVPGTYHTGGIVGVAGSTGPMMPLSLWTNARRYHGGGPVLGADEVPIIAKRREEVLTEDDPRHSDNIGRRGRGSAGGGRTEVHIHPPAETRATTRETDLGGGNMRIDVLFERIEGAMAENLGRQRGPLFGSMVGTFGLQPRGRG